MTVDQHAARETIQAENAELRTSFREWLGSRGISRRTIDRHDANIRVYTDDYLLYDDAIEVAQGASAAALRTFFDDWFLRKGPWSSPTSIRNMAASLRKFYAFMQEAGQISPRALRELNATIQTGLPGWQDALLRYCGEDGPWDL